MNAKSQNYEGFNYLFSENMLWMKNRTSELHLKTEILYQIASGDSQSKKNRLRGLITLGLYISLLSAIQVVSVFSFIDFLLENYGNLWTNQLFYQLTFLIPANFILGPINVYLGFLAIDVLKSLRGNIENSFALLCKRGKIHIGEVSNVEYFKDYKLIRYDIENYNNNRGKYSFSYKTSSNSSIKPLDKVLMLAWDVNLYCLL